VRLRFVSARHDIPGRRCVTTAVVGSAMRFVSADARIGLRVNARTPEPAPTSRGTLFYRRARCDVDRCYARPYILQVLRCTGSEPSTQPPRA
jgi:hypothetical protein